MSIESVLQRIIPDVEFHQNRYARLLGETVRSDIDWLDVGAGARLHSGWKYGRPQDVAERARAVIGCDLVPHALLRNKAITAGVVADITSLPFGDESFDLVTANMVVEHLSDPLHAFAEVARLLRPGGEFVFLTPNRWHPAVGLAAALVPSGVRTTLARVIERREARDIFPTHYRANTASRVRSLARQAGFEPTSIEVFSSYPFFKRPIALLALEAHWIRLMQRSGITRFGSNILVRLVRGPLV